MATIMDEAAPFAQEAEERSVVLRRLPGREQEALPLAEAVARLAEEAKPPG